jgi:hypothetical protein
MKLSGRSTTLKGGLPEFFFQQVAALPATWWEGGLEMMSNLKDIEGVN